MDETPEPQPLDPQSLNLFYYPKDRLRLTVGDEKSYHTVKPAWAAPLSRPGSTSPCSTAKGTRSSPSPTPPPCRPPHSRPPRRSCGGAI